MHVKNSNPFSLVTFKARKKFAIRVYSFILKNGIEYSARIIEMIFSKNANEESNYPTFEIMDANEDSSNNGNTTSSGTMGSSGNSSGTIPTVQVSFYTKDDVDKLFLKKADDVALTEDEINEICVWQ